MLKGEQGYYFLLSLETISLIGSSFTAFLITLWAWETFGNASFIAQVLAAFFIPRLLLGPIAGVFVDRWDRKVILIVANLCSAIAIGFLTVLYANGELRFWHIWVLGFVQSFLVVFRQPSLDASMRLMVPDSRIPRATTLVQTVRPIARIIGPLLAGLIVGIWPKSTLFIIDTITFLIAGAGTMFASVPRLPPKSKSNPRVSFFSDMISGAMFIARTRPLLMCTIGSALFNICGGAFLGSLLLPMAGTVWRYQPLAITVSDWIRDIGGTTGALPAQLSATVNSVLFLGMFIGGFITASFGFPFRKSAYNVAIATLIAGVGQASMGASNFIVPITSAFIMGLTAPWLNAPVRTIWIRTTPPELQGRVLSTEGLISQMTYPLGLLLVTVGSERLSPGKLFVISGIALAAGALFWVLNPDLKKIEDSGKVSVDAETSTTIRSPGNKPASTQT